MSEVVLPSALPSPRARRGLMALVLLGVAALLAGAALQAPRVWSGVLIGFLMIIGLGLGGALFLAINAASGARWATFVRRVPEAMAATLLSSAALVLLLVWAAGRLYPWAQPGFMDSLPILAGKKGWLSLGFFSLRSVVYVTAWAGLVWLILRNYRAQDRDGRARTSANRKLGIVFLIVFGYTFCLSSFDWIMSLEPTWCSTVFGLYCFAGVMQCGFATALLLVLYLDSKGVFRGELRGQHLHDLGKWLFAFSCFWAYMWFCQYMLTWFSDLPDENQYYLLRHGQWDGMMVVVVCGRFAVPFFGLASQAAKKNRRVLAGVAGLVLLMHWLDLVLMVMPSVAANGALLDPFCLLLPLAAVAGFLLLFFRSFRAHRAVPAPDAAMAYSRHYS